ncbi:hypothetical protein D3C73_1198850 [compost metagenome]
MTQRVPRYCQNLEGHAHRGHFVTFVQGKVAARNTLVGRAADPRTGQFFQPLDTAHVVIVVVGDQNILQHPVGIGGQPCLHGGGITRIDHRAAAFGSIL